MPEVIQRALVISGSPGCGKSSVSAAMAEASPRGVHLITDEFFGFLAHTVDPSLPESNDQNEVVGKAWLGAARAYIEGGYDVMIDGVIGDWWFYLIGPELRTFDYVILHASVEVTLERCAARDGQDVQPDMIQRMHPHFEKLTARMPNHVVDTSRRSLDEVVSEISRLRTSGQLQVAHE